MDTPGFITPPPGLIPPREDTGTHTERMPQRTALPAFNPPESAQAAASSGETGAPRSWLVILPSGARIPVNGALLVGRNPVRFEPWTGAGLLPVDDPARSVSKTHAVLQETQEGVRVTDLHSTNGVSVIDASGATTALAAGTAAALDAGATVLLGSFRLRLVQA